MNFSAREAADRALAHLQQSYGYFTRARKGDATVALKDGRNYDVEETVITARLIKPAVELQIDEPAEELRAEVLRLVRAEVARLPPTRPTVASLARELQAVKAELEQARGPS